MSGRYRSGSWDNFNRGFKSYRSYHFSKWLDTQVIGLGPCVKRVPRHNGLASRPLGRQWSGYPQYSHQFQRKGRIPGVYRGLKIPRWWFDPIPFHQFQSWNGWEVKRRPSKTEYIAASAISSSKFYAPIPSWFLCWSKGLLFWSR